MFLPDRAWDERVFSEAMRYIRTGVDPYPASLALQQAQAALGHDKGESALGHRVFIYWYPPISIEFLKLLNLIPALLRGSMFWIVYAVGFGLQLWAGSRFALEDEWRTLRFLLPLTMFFPAFVPSDTLLSGNLAIPVYGMVLAAAVRGWREDRWGVFFVVVIAASLLKPPMLIWLAVPLFLGAKQLIPAGGAALSGVVLFSVQKLLWPQRFDEFMSAIRYTLPLEINYSVVARFEELLRSVGRSSDRAVLALYAGVVLAVFGALTYFAREFRRQNISGQTFAAVVLVSTALFAPRVKEYDLLPLTIPMALIVLRAVQNRVALILLFLGAAAVGAALLTDHVTAIDTISVMTVFLVGVHGLSTEAKAARALRDSAKVAIPEAVQA